MRVLYLDTSSSFLYFGIVENNNLIISIKKIFEKDLSKNTLFEIDKIFKESNIDPKSIDKIILVNGPGSFTGVRIGITIAKTYAWALNIPIVTISSLYAMALSNKDNTDFIIPIIDARRDYCYSAIYDRNYNPVMNEQYVSLNTLLIAIKNLGDNYIVVSNDNYSFNHIKYDPDILKIVNMSQNLTPIKNIHMLTANYLKKSEAEEKFNDTVIG